MKLRCSVSVTVQFSCERVTSPSRPVHIVPGIIAIKNIIVIVRPFYATDIRII